jgi:hypothetical protein
MISIIRGDRDGRDVSDLGLAVPEASRGAVAEVATVALAPKWPVTGGMILMRGTREPRSRPSRSGPAGRQACSGT